MRNPVRLKRNTNGGGKKAARLEIVRCVAETRIRNGLTNGADRISESYVDDILHGDGCCGFSWVGVEGLCGLYDDSFLLWIGG